ncbi:MAG: NADH-quinone oxidoreductase subunit N [Anaerolineae bacterium]|nr:NADH-quinone oxidoreductase subunit N [Anaerolineae bacterium]MCB0236044.1 NADH-quinone oxidoreductase subunit N [Anaerolineae bacterium]MCB0237285.1 NADH-quinone oxidoreductase subunit N [Anaerolineae bacterium]MCB0250311.1 NADH-quinone oxidoreductase subunit N [Anaerolineae bacterium]MCB9143281.1 NADH-quinone oxidoreductase subunit N [Anaerolineales bacterium]
MTVDTLRLLLPELILVVTGLVVITIDLITLRRINDAVLAGVSVAGLLLAALAAFTLRGLPPQAATPMLAIDGFATFLMVAALIGMALVVLYSLDYMRKYGKNRGEYYAFLLAVSLAIILAVSANNLLMVWLAMEFLSITSYILVGYLRGDARSNEGAIKYFLYGAVASGVMLYGISLIYGATGTLSLNGVAQVISGEGVLGSRALGFTAVVLLIAGFGFKTSLVPFHQWAPDTYEGAPTPITGFLSTASKLAGFALLVRTMIVALPSLSVDWLTVLAGISMITMTFGNLVALKQTNMKRLLAYSSIAQAGYILMGLVAVPQIGYKILPFSDFTFNGINGVLIYLFGYIFTNLGAFAVIIAIENRTGKVEVKDYAGLIYRSPWLASLLLIFLLSLTGIPPTLGFWGKYFVFGAAMQIKFYPLAAVALINAAIAAGYYLNVIRYMFLMPAEDEEKIGISRAISVTLAVCAAAVLLLGIAPSALITWATESAQFLTRL